MALRALSAKKANRKARLRGKGSVLAVQQAIPTPAKVLRRVFQEIGLEPAEPSAKRGRPRKDAIPDPGPVTRQQRRYLERVRAKGALVWSEVTGGAGVALVDGKPVPVKGGKP